MTSPGSKGQADAKAPSEGLPVMEIFATLQGEGYHTGKPAVFVRLAGCDLACHWCDVKESWNAGCWPEKPLAEIMDEIEAFRIPAVVVTGGEPLMNDLNDLTIALKSKGYDTFLETSGSYPMTGIWDWICLSPKEQQPPLQDNLALAHELKVVVQAPADLHWAEKHAALVSPGCKCFLQPEWSVWKEVTPLITDYILRNPRWMLSLQSHKYIGIP
ncbi:MAG TPA: 7-carboxy-7-deazaguanine synthase QueE [Bacteroidales bacterium]|nr:7-carboxy-7-deazaguanine synthase QueE [Bacteroidales bacterium]HRZ49455.1 7-carboxy-7-deazaguanine synthase QueE [Bacteroidales bacterium]